MIRPVTVVSSLASLALLLIATTGPAKPVAAITAEAEQVWETGVVQRVSDGDTVQVTILTATNPEMFAPATGETYCRNRITAAGRIPEEGLTGCSVRMVAIQAPETAGHGVGGLGQCGAEQAEKALAKALPVGTPVQLRSINVASGDPKYSGGRLVRSVYAPDGAGGWVDVARALYRGGLALWFPFNVGDTEKAEYAHNLEYRRLADEAAAAGRGMWAANLCGPSAPANLRMWVVSDPAGRDAAAGETVIVWNDADTALDISGWTLRDSSLKYLQVPAGTVIGPHDYLNINSGTGTNGQPQARDIYWGRTDNVFANFESAAGYYHGDAAYLFDAQPGFDYGNLRAWYHYPCDPDDCWDPMVGKLTIGRVTANPSGDDTARGEAIEIRNQTRGPASLGGYRLTWDGGAYDFDPQAVLGARKTLRVVLGRGTDGGRVVHVGLANPGLSNGGATIMLRHVDAAIIDCRAYGNARCPTGAPQSISPDLASQRTGRTLLRPGPPESVTGQVSGKRIVVNWQAPQWFGRTPIQRYEARVYKRVAGRYVRVGSCRAYGEATACRSGKVKLGKGLFVAVRARNSKGTGPASKYVPVTQVTQAAQLGPG